jgi:hypothetical protein
MMETIVVFLTSANREVVKSALGFVKIAVVTLRSTAIVTPTLPTLVPALINWSHEHSNHFKVKIRHLLERMIRKYGYQEVERYVPEEDKRLVSNIRKRQARSKKKKAAAMDVDGEQGSDAEVRLPSLFLFFPFFELSSLSLSAGRAETSNRHSLRLRRSPLRLRLGPFRRFRQRRCCTGCWRR